MRFALLALISVVCPACVGSGRVAPARVRSHHGAAGSAPAGTVVSEAPLLWRSVEGRRLRTSHADGASEAERRRALRWIRYHMRRPRCLSRRPGGSSGYSCSRRFGKWAVRSPAVVALDADIDGIRVICQASGEAKHGTLSGASTGDHSRRHTRPRPACLGRAFGPDLPLPPRTRRPGADCENLA
jgi:hypothetical protein